MRFFVGLLSFRSAVTTSVNGPTQNNNVHQYNIIQYVLIIIYRFIVCLLQDENKCIPVALAARLAQPAYGYLFLPSTSFFIGHFRP